MNILIIGRGVIATQYAYIFNQQGHHIDFYIRPESKEKYSSDLLIEFTDGRTKQQISEHWQTSLVYHIHPNYDMIIVSVNPDQIDNVVTQLHGNTGSATLLFFNNFWQDPLHQTQGLSHEQCIFGFPGGGGGSITPNHIKGGLTKMVYLSHYGQPEASRYDQVADLFQTAGFNINYQKNFRKWLWNHFALITALEVEVIKTGSFSQLIHSRPHLDNVVVNLKQYRPLIEAKGETFDLTNNIVSSLPRSVVGQLLYEIFKLDMLNHMMSANTALISSSVSQLKATADAHHISVPSLESALKYIKLAEQ